MDALDNRWILLELDFFSFFTGGTIQRHQGIFIT